MTVDRVKDRRQLLALLRERGEVEVLEQSKDTVHLIFDGVDVSIFILRRLGKHAEDRALGVTGILASKTHALLDRGLRRDFFDLYVMLQTQSLGLVDCLRALRDVYEQDVHEGLVLRALSYFEDADTEPRLPGEGKNDWALVKSFFQTAVAALVVPPLQPLAIQKKIVDVR